LGGGALLRPEGPEFDAEGGEGVLWEMAASHLEGHGTIPIWGSAVSAPSAGFEAPTENAF